jgi:hypothetical protein
MTSPAQLTANRANAQLSTGPVTEAGKHTVSQNSLKHGLSGNTHAALPGEQDRFAQYTHELLEAFAPAGTREHELVHDIAADRWRLKRARSMENALFEQVMATAEAGPNPATAQVLAWADPATGLQRVALYLGRIQRALDRNTDALEALQSHRKAAYAQAQAEAILLAKQAYAHGKSYDPAPDFTGAEDLGGFAYSSPEIARVISRANRLEEARARFAPAA